MQPTVSILVPCYNAAPWLAETLESALAQTWEDKEIVLVDDGSTDDSLAIARKFEARGVKVIAQANQGASAARNAAFEASSGEWIQYLDADDLLAPGKIEQQMRFAAEVGQDMILCAKWGRFRKTPEDAVFAHQPLCTDASAVEWIVLKGTGQASYMMHPAAWLVPRQLVGRAGPWDVRLSLDDDGEFFNRAVLASAGVRYCADATSYYRSNLAGSLSGRRSDAAWQSAYLSVRLCVDQLLAAEDSTRTRGACADMYQRLSYTMYPACPGLIRACTASISRLGGSAIRPEGGSRFRLASRIVGWKLAKRLRLMCA